MATPPKVSFFLHQNSEMSEYKNKVGELRSENDYQLRLKDMNYGEKIKEMRETHTQDMEALRAQYEVKTWQLSHVFYSTYCICSLHPPVLSPRV